MWTPLWSRTLTGQFFILRVLADLMCVFYTLCRAAPRGVGDAKVAGNYAGEYVVMMCRMVIILEFHIN